MNTNIPIYRAKMINSDDYVEGWLLGEFIVASFYPSYMYGNSTKLNTTHHQIDPTTLSIHFSDMLDSEGTKIFASLSEDGKGGDTLAYLLSFVHIATARHTGLTIFASSIGCYINVGSFRNCKVIGVQQ